jgi:hypothetical protein
MPKTYDIQDISQYFRTNFGLDVCNLEWSWKGFVGIDVVGRRDGGMSWFGGGGQHRQNFAWLGRRNISGG